MVQGKIIKGIAGFYYVHIAGDGIYECKAKGIFRKNHVKPLVGDDAGIDILSSQEKTGNIIEIFPRKNTLVRPAVANIDQALVIFSVVKPAPNFNLLDRFLILMKQQGLPCIICFNKRDIATEEEMQKLYDVYKDSGSKIIFVSAKEKSGLEQLRELLKQRTTTAAGPSGVGKSSLINVLQSAVEMETGEISRKIERGKHTTRHSELIALGESAYIMDTPGFSSLTVESMEKEELRDYYREFDAYEPACKFQVCAHINEPKCGVKEALDAGNINIVRYENYVQIYNELKNKKKY